MKAVIFDMDGVIIDSHSIASRLLCETANNLGCSLTLEELRGWGSLSSRQFWEKVKRDYNLTETIPQLIGTYEVEREIELYQEIGLIPGIKELLEDLRRNSIITALATSASRRRMNAVLDLFEIRRLFNECVCDEDVSTSKPDPEIHTRASEKISVPPDECIVIEDSYNGMTAAKRAGMRCIGYKGLSHVTEDLRECDLIIYNFNELSTENLNEIFSR